MQFPADWIVPDWPAAPRVRALITTRSGGVSVGSHASLNLGLECGDAPFAVHANRQRLRALLPQEPRWMKQVHGTRVVDADQLSEVVEADASYARAPGTVCAVMVADCLPVLLASRAGDVIGVAHAGWRGLAAGVLEATVAAMKCAPHELIAYLGPAISARAFEVGGEVRAAFLAADGAAETAFSAAGAKKWMADLDLLARQRLQRCGVSAVYGDRLCTYCDPERFYSYRRDGVTGRMAALIWIAPSSGET